MKATILKLDDQGRGICYINNKITFVSHTLPNEEVDLELIKENSKYQIGKVKEIIKASPNRLKSLCPYYEQCGGCQLLHTSYEETLKFKEYKIKDILNKFADININSISITPSPNFHYRNKITLKISAGKYGYYSEDSHILIPITKCLLVKEEINNFIPHIGEFNIQNGQIIIRSNYNQELLIAITSTDPITIPQNLTKYKVAGIVHNGKTIYGNNSFIEILNKKFFEISYDSFFQINNDITSIILDTIKKQISTNQIVLDLYCGVGLLGIGTYNNNKKLYGIEIIPNAILNAIKNSKMNKIPNVYYHLGDVSKIIAKINDQIDIVIVDPPRRGLDQKTINTILNIQPNQIIYMSCDPITLARDLKILKEKYKIESIQAFDMFPYTYHIESLCFLKLLH